MNTVTKEEVLANMQDIIVKTVVEFDKPCTYVTVRMKNGFTLRESTTCVDPSNYDESIGKDICLKKINDKVWFLLGYKLQDDLYNTPKDFKDRLNIEFKELNDKFIKLDTFISSDDFETKVTDEEQRILLETQRKFMAGYLECLEERIDKLNS